MKIALLNLPIDNNYGGNLQRYALMKVLQDMGHDVTHIYIKYISKLPWYKMPYSYSKRFILRYFFRKNVHINEESYRNRHDDDNLKSILLFYDKYIKHTKCCYSIHDVIRETKGKFDAYVVGSDQVWRKGMTGQIDLKNYFFDFVREEAVKRFAYGVSLGVDVALLNRNEMRCLEGLYNKFDAVSVREISALDIFCLYGWTHPKAALCLDPTLLLEEEDYVKLIVENNAENITEGRIFGYILDKCEKTDKLLDYYKRALNKDVVEIGLDDTSKVPVTQWLNNIRLADIVVTDSYHGVVFSILFRRPFVFVGNKRRGNARIESLFKVLNIEKSNVEVRDFSSIEKCLIMLKTNSFAFLKNI